MGIENTLHAQTGDWTDFISPGLNTTGGKGESKDNPILIESEEDLAFLARDVRSGSAYPGKYFKLTKNLDLKAHYWVSIGAQNTNPTLSKPFQGHFDGGGFTISNMIIQPVSGESKGLFGYITTSLSSAEKASIGNVFLEGAVVEGNSSTGGLVGVAVNSVISDCSVLGTIRNVQNYAGGIVASASGCEITRCYSNISFGDVTNSVGGLVGRLGNASTLSTSYSAGVITGLINVGGLVGAVEGGSVVTNCYSMANIADDQDSGGVGGAPAGGIVGTMDVDSKISNCFARNSWIKGVTSGNNVNRIVGIATFIESMLQNNVAFANMSVSRDAGVNFAKIQDEPVDPQNTPNGKSVVDFCDWDGGSDWIEPEDDCITPPHLPEQSAPVTRVTNTTKEIIVKHQPAYGGETGEYGTVTKIILLNSEGVTLAVGAQIVSVGGLENNEWKFTPKKPAFAFNLGDVFFAVAYENGKMPSYPVQIIITPWEGNGKDIPYEIHTESQLDSVRYFPDANYKLMEDLDMSAYPEKFEPVGTKDEPFTGNFDGNNHIIDNLVINNPGEDNQGLFGVLDGSVNNLGLENVYVVGDGFVGALAGDGNSTKAIIQNVYTTGTIKSTGDNAGGLAGRLAAKVLRCYSTCMVAGSNNIGGLIGTTLGDVESCYAAGPVFGLGTTGGFIGESRATVKLSYSWGLVTALDQEPDDSFGGFIGLVLGLSKMEACYYNPVTSAQDKSVGNSVSGCMSSTPNQITQSLKVMPDWNVNNVTGYYPQLSVFANNSVNLNFSYCSALSVVPVNFVSNETAGAVKTSFLAPSKYAIGGVEKDDSVVIPTGGSATCSVSEGKVISFLPAGEVDTLKITVEAFELLTPVPEEKIKIYERFRHICFIPDQELPDCSAERIAGNPNENGWSNENVVYRVQTTAANGIGGPVKYQQNVIPFDSQGEVDNWAPLQGDLHEFDRDTTDIKVQYRALNGAGGIGESTLPEPVNVDKTLPVISDVSDVSDPNNPVKNQAEISVTFKDELSGVAAAQWQIGDSESKKGDVDISQITPDAEGNLTAKIILPKVAGHYPFTLIVADKAGNETNSNDAGKSIDLYVEIDDVDLNDYLLDDVTVNGEDVVPEDENNPYNYKTDFCVVEETAEVILTPAPAFEIDPIVMTVTGLKYGNNPVIFTIESKDGSVIQTFTINICREILVASFLFLSVNEEEIKIKPGIFDYSIPYVEQDVDRVLVEYVLPEGEACNRDPENSTEFDDESPYSYDFPLEPGQNIIKLAVVSTDGTTTNTYNISIVRRQNIVIIDDIDYEDGNLELDPDTNNPSPRMDEDGNIVYDLISKCEADNHYLKITPDPANTIVTFNGAAKSDNTYKFDVANHYRVEVVVAAETPRTYIFNVLKRFNKDIFYFRWSTNDVVSVINNPANNGGYSFAGYSWYLNDAANPETRSYLEVKSGDKVEVILTGEYNSEATGTIPISGVPTCPCMVGSSTQANIQAYPSILNTGEKVTIATENMSDVDLKGAEAGIISPLGSRITSIPLTGSKTEVKMPDAPGIYLLKVSTNSITREFKVILK